MLEPLDGAGAVVPLPVEPLELLELLEPLAGAAVAALLSLELLVLDAACETR
ncbi:MAG TPA: hypothetical protein VI316_03375 [Candidatus Dormibacteraeota bacterium]